MVYDILVGFKSQAHDVSGFPYPTNKECMRGEGCGENGERVSSGVGAALGIHPHQGHGPDSTIHCWARVSLGLSRALNRIARSLLLETSFPLGFRDTTFRLPGPSLLPLDLHILEGPTLLSMRILPQEICSNAQALSSISMLIHPILPSPLSSTCIYSEVPRGCVIGLQT